MPRIFSIIIATIKCWSLAFLLSKKNQSTFYRTAANRGALTCNLSEHDMRVAMLAFAGLIGLSAVPTGISASPAGAIRGEAGSAPYFVEVAQGMRPRLSLGRQAPQPVRCLGPGTLRKKLT
jgi:hypothetical protein